MNQINKYSIKYYFAAFLLIFTFATIAGFSRATFLKKEFKIIKKASSDSSQKQSIQSKEEVKNNADFMDFENLLSTIPDSEYKEIGLDSAFYIYNNQLAYFIDARSSSKFSISHINGALSIPYPFYDFKGDQIVGNEILDRVDSLHNINLDKPITIYCNDTLCGLGKDLASYFVEELYLDNIMYFDEGYAGWDEQQYLGIKYCDCNDALNEEECGCEESLLNNQNDNDSQKNVEDSKNIGDTDSGKNQNESKKISKKKDFNLFKNLLFDDYILIISFFMIILMFKINKFKSFIPLIAQLLLAYIFITFSFGKILDPISFVNDIENYDIIPKYIFIGTTKIFILNITCLILPWIEMFLGVIFLLGSYKLSQNIIDGTTSFRNNTRVNLTDASSIYIMFLLVMFISMISIAFYNGKSIECGCSTSDLPETEKFAIRFRMLVRIFADFFLLGLALIVKYRSKFLLK